MENELFKTLNLLADIQTMITKKDFNNVSKSEEVVKFIKK